MFRVMRLKVKVTLVFDDGIKRLARGKCEAHVHTVELVEIADNVKTTSPSDHCTTSTQGR